MPYLYPVRNRVREARRVAEGRFPIREEQLEDLQVYLPIILEQCRGEFEDDTFLRSEVVNYILNNCDPFQNVEFRDEPSEPGEVRSREVRFIESQVRAVLDTWTETNVLTEVPDESAEDDPAYRFCEKS